VFDAASWHILAPRGKMINWIKVTAFRKSVRVSHNIKTDVVSMEMPNKLLCLTLLQNPTHHMHPFHVTRALWMSCVLSM